YELAVERHVAESRAFHADIAKFPIGEPRHIIAGADVRVITGKRHVQLADDSVGFGDFFRFQPFALEHVHEIGVAAKIQLVGAIQAHAPLAKEIGQYAMGDGGAHLRFDVVADDGQPAVGKALLPVRLGSDEDRDAINKCAARFEHLFDVPFGGHFRADRQIGDDHVGAGGFEDADDVVGGSLGFGDNLAEIFAKAVVRHATMHRNAERWNVGKLAGVIRGGKNGFRQIFADLGGVDVEGGAEFDVANVIAAQAHVHEAGHRLLFTGLTV